KEFNELSNPVVTEIDNQKWSLNISDIPIIDEVRSIFLGHDLSEMDYLEIKRPNLLPCPNPIESLIEWIKSDWKKLSIDRVEVAEKLPRVSLDDKGDLVYNDEFFADDQARVDTYNLWLSKRKSWQVTETPRAKGLDLYNRLFQLYSAMKLESESVELILGDGNIRWYTPDRIIDHPVLLQKVHLHFDAHLPSFRVYCEEKKSELYTPMLRVIPSINQKMLSDIISEIDDGDYDLAITENTEALFKRIINVIDINGVFNEQCKPINETATIHSAPILFLRKHTLGFSSFIEGVIEDVQDNSEVELPGFFEIMSGVYKDKPQEEIAEKSWNHNGIDEEVLLTLPANNEQLRIIKYMEKSGAVLVQGPPGTGKTHTIANLIGHLLSQGNSVLVTSHTEKALTVLKEKVYRDPLDPELNLQNLCISILSSTSQKNEMDAAINEIASKSSSIDLHSSLLKVKRLKEERKELINQSRKLTEELVRARSMEYKDLIFDNHTIVPIDAAKFLNRGKDLFDYMTGKSNNDEVGFPLRHEELIFLYSSNDQLSSEEEHLLKKTYPSSGQIIGSFDFAEKVDRMNALRKVLDDKPILEAADFLVSIDTVNYLLDESSKLISMISGFEPLERSIINRTMVDPTYPKLWDDVLEKTECIQAKYE
ncbi:MAG TPA: AAA domain-containing protein, partial [Anaerovoracaceae bacterium]|nr:AAA domain-containing protein [Anaerovoracaceae bacterium]